MCGPTGRAQWQAPHGRSSSMQVGKAACVCGRMHAVCIAALPVMLH